MFALLEIFAQLEAYEICCKTHTTHTHLTLRMLLYYLRKLKTQIFCRYSADVEENAYSPLYNYVIHPQILIFSEFKIAICYPYWLQVKLSMSLFFYLFTFAINMWHRKFVTADVAAVFVNSGIQQREQDFDKST